MLKKLLLSILIISMGLAQELEVEGDLKVTGTVESSTIDSLEQVIQDLQSQITALQIQFDNFQSNDLITGTVSDIDGNIYQTVQIGVQIWMAENLKVTRFNNGDEISLVEPDLWWQQFEPTYYIHENSNTYGFYYNGFVANDEREVCPEDWHIPTDEEFIQLINYNGGSQIAGGKMKIPGYEYWDIPNDGATNESGFSGLPAGKLSYSSGEILEINTNAYFWSTSEHYNNDFNWGQQLFYSNTAGQRTQLDKREGSSIRCIAD